MSFYKCLVLENSNIIIIWFIFVVSAYATKYHNMFEYLELFGKFISFISKFEIKENKEKMIYYLKPLLLFNDSKKCEHRKNVIYSFLAIFKVQ